MIATGDYNHDNDDKNYNHDNDNDDYNHDNDDDDYNDDDHNIALCGYPLVKVTVEKICSCAPILLRLGYFRQNTWRLSSTQFHF